MTETRKKIEVIRRANYRGSLKKCEYCEEAPCLFVVDPVGSWLREVLKNETFFAVVCSCGREGPFYSTGKAANGTQIDERCAAEMAAAAWNTGSTIKA